LGAIAVNLVAGEKPADVYTGIATRYVFCVNYILNCKSVTCS